MHFDALAGDWHALTSRLQRSGTWSRWRHAEPILSAVDATDFLTATAKGPDRPLADDRLGALVRIAAVDGGNEPDAALVALHLLRPGICAMTAKFAHRGPDVPALVTGEVISIIRTYPWQRRRHAFAAGILLDAKHVLWRSELAPSGTTRNPVPVDPARLHRDYQTPVDQDQSPDTELVDLLLLAVQAGAVTADDLRLLVDTELHRSYGTASRERVAAAHGITERTLRRRRERTITALRNVATQHLAA